MNVTNEVFPTDPDKIAAMQQAGPPGPIIMVNLLKFHAQAQYADGRETDLSGRDAYMLYARAVAELLPKFGGKALVAADVTFLALGEVEELWDEVALVQYPNRAALWAMSSSPEWRELAVHRQAGLAGQLNIETVAQPGFGALGASD